MVYSRERALPLKAGDACNGLAQALYAAQAQHDGQRPQTSPIVRGVMS